MHDLRTRWCLKPFSTAAIVYAYSLCLLLHILKSTAILRISVLHLIVIQKTYIQLNGNQYIRVYKLQAIFLILVEHLAVQLDGIISIPNYNHFFLLLLFIAYSSKIYSSQELIYCKEYNVTCCCGRLQCNFHVVTIATMIMANKGYQSGFLCQCINQIVTLLVKQKYESILVLPGTISEGIVSI